jgi:hypothetical protein
MSMADREEFRYLTAPLREVAQHHLDPDENVLMSIYAHPTIHLIHNRWLGFTWTRQVQLPARAFVLTPQRSLIVEDPTDPATSTADRKYLVASCSLNRVILFELRSYLLDCALTLVMASSQGPERITIEYNGVSENAFLAAVACMRALIDGQRGTTRPVRGSVRPHRRAGTRLWQG